MAYANSYTQKEYYLNSVASPIYINPVDMDFKGLSAELMFFKIYRKNRSMDNTPWKIQKCCRAFSRK
jgi:protease-4